MSFIEEIVKTIVDTGKKAIQKEVKEQTENTIESVTDKVTNTISDVGDKFENTVKTSINDIGNQSYNNQVIPNINQINSNNPLSNQSTESTNINIANTSNSNLNTSNNSIASDIANILEKQNIMDRESLSNNAGILEQGLTAKINEVTDAINTMYNKDTTQNDNITDIKGAFNHLLDATSNIGTATDNEFGKALNEAIKDTPDFNKGLNELNKESTNLINKVQEGIDDFKDVN